MIGLDFLQNDWWNNATWGIAAIAIPAIWQLSGYVMALFLAGFRGIPEELREAARMDGASRVAALPPRLFPQLTPGRAVRADHHRPHVAQGLRPDHGDRRPANYQTKVPAVYMWIVFKSSFDYAKAAADRHDPAGHRRGR